MDHRNPWVAKLSAYTRLADDDIAFVGKLSACPRHFAADTDIISHGHNPAYVNVMLDGFAARYKMLPDGRRQIVAFLLPGDICDLHVFLLHQMDHSIGTLTESRVARVPRATILDILDRRPVLARALWINTLVDEAILREWIVNIGRRSAYQRISHLLAELFVRYRLVGRANGNGFHLPLTQQELADTLGLSLVHVNRNLQRLRGEGIIATRGRRLEILRADRLREIANFDPDYLHFDVRDAVEA